MPIRRFIPPIAPMCWKTASWPSKARSLPTIPASRKPISESRIMSTQGGDYSIFKETMADMTFPELARAAASRAVVLWGLGVIEQHGPHLSLGTDVYMPSELLRRVRTILATKGVSSVIMPPFYWGVNQVSGLFPGSFMVRPEVMIELMVDLIKSLKNDSFSTLFCVSGHGDALHNRTIFDGGCRGADESGLN